MFFAFIPLRKELIFVAVTLGKLKIIHYDGCQIKHSYENLPWCAFNLGELSHINYSF